MCNALAINAIARFMLMYYMYVCTGLTTAAATGKRHVE
jgi:hypothetical protein